MYSHATKANIVQMLLPELIIQATESATVQEDSVETDNEPDFYHNHHGHVPIIPLPPPMTATTAGEIRDAALNYYYNNKNPSYLPMGSDSNSSLHNELRRLFWQTTRRWAKLYERNRKRYQKIMVMLMFSGLLTSAAFQRGFVYTPSGDVVVYCVIYSMWVTTCLPWLLLHLDGKTIGVILGVILRLFAADIGVLGYAAWRGDTHIFHRGLRLKPVMESSLSWLAEAGYSLRFAVVVASVTASTVKTIIDTSFTSPISVQKKQDKEANMDPETCHASKEFDALFVNSTGNKVKKEDSGIIKHKIIKSRPQKRKDRDNPFPIQENVGANRPPSKGNSAQHHSNQRKLTNKSQSVENHSPNERNVASRSPSQMKIANEDTTKKNATSHSPSGKNLANRYLSQKNLANNSPPAKFKDTKNYSRLSKEKRGTSREEIVELRPWKKTNPTIFSPAKSWKNKNNVPDGVGRFMRAGENISFNKKVEVDDSNMTQNLDYGIISYSERKGREEEEKEEEEEWGGGISEGGGGGGRRRWGRGSGERMHESRRDGTETKLGNPNNSEQGVKSGSGSYYERELMKRRLMMMTAMKKGRVFEENNNQRKRKTRLQKVKKDGGGSKEMKN